MAELRAHGLSYQEIAEHLGTSKQLVFYTLSAKRPERKPRHVRCRHCGGEINPAGALRRDDQNVLCVTCVESHPRWTIGERLRAYRLAAGLKITELARRAGLSGSAISSCEHGRHNVLSHQALVRLFEILGASAELQRDPLRRVE
jgi:transcriptional regulator with XRE-family HTH domain